MGLWRLDGDFRDAKWTEFADKTGSSFTRPYLGGNQTKLTDGETKQTGQDEWADRRRDEPNRRKDETAKTGEAAG